MQEQIVSFETAKLAKGKGFNLECKLFHTSKDRPPLAYNISAKESTGDNPQYNKYILAPTQSLLAKWLRELPTPIIVTPTTDFVAWEAEIAHPDKDLIIITKDKEGKWFNSYEDAFEIGLFKALKKVPYIDINQSDYYQHNKPELRERTKKRLREIAEFGMEEVGHGQFGIKGVMSGFYIEKVWYYSNVDFKDYMDWVKSLKKEKV